MYVFPHSDNPRAHSIEKNSCKLRENPPNIYGTFFNKTLKTSRIKKRTLTTRNDFDQNDHDHRDRDRLF